jgi:hypothetical protein
MKYATLLLGAALLLATTSLHSTAQAQANLHQCSLNFYKAHLNNPRSRWNNHMRKVAVTAPYSAERLRLRDSAGPLIQAARRYCDSIGRPQWDNRP